MFFRNAMGGIAFPATHATWFTVCDVRHEKFYPFAEGSMIIIISSTTQRYTFSKLPCLPSSGERTLRGGH